MEERDDTVGAPHRQKRRYTLAEDRIVPNWYDTRHVPWMLRRAAKYNLPVVKAGRVLRRLKPDAVFDEVARCELDDLTATSAEARRMMAAALPVREFAPDWLSDLLRLAALSGEVSGATPETLARLLRWRPGEADASVAARTRLHGALYRELEPLLRDVMRVDRAERPVRPPRRKKDGGF